MTAANRTSYIRCDLLAPIDSYLNPHIFAIEYRVSRSLMSDSNEESRKLPGYEGRAGENGSGVLIKGRIVKHPGVKVMLRQDHV
jgi:hypothetical protein